MQQIIGTRDATVDYHLIHRFWIWSLFAARITGLMIQFINLFGRQERHECREHSMDMHWNHTNLVKLVPSEQSHRSRWNASIDTQGAQTPKFVVANDSSFSYFCQIQMSIRKINDSQMWENPAYKDNGANEPRYEHDNTGTAAFQSNEPSHKQKSNSSGNSTIEHISALQIHTWAINSMRLLPIVIIHRTVHTHPAHTMLGIHFKLMWRLGYVFFLQR